MEHRHDGEHPRAPAPARTPRPSRPASSAGRSSGGCRRRPSGCRWCRTCSTARPRPARPRRASRTCPAGRAAGPPTGAAPTRPTGRGLQRGEVAAADDHDVAQRGQVRQHPGQQRDQRRVDDDHPVLGVVGDVDQLLREQAEVEGVQHRAHARHRQVGDEVLGVVPHQGGDPLVAGDPEVVAQRMGQARRVGGDLLVRGPARTVGGPGDHLGRAVNVAAVLQQPRHLQRGVHHRATHDKTLRPGSPPPTAPDRPCEIDSTTRPVRADDAAPVGKRRLSIDLTPLRSSRDFSLVFTASGVSAIGSYLTFVSIPYQVFLLTHDPLLVGLHRPVRAGPAAVHGVRRRGPGRLPGPPAAGGGGRAGVRRADRRTADQLAGRPAAAVAAVRRGRTEHDHRRDPAAGAGRGRPPAGRTRADPGRRRAQQPPDERRRVGRPGPGRHPAAGRRSGLGVRDRPRHLRGQSGLPRPRPPGAAATRPGPPVAAVGRDRPAVRGQPQGAARHLPGRHQRDVLRHAAGAVPVRRRPAGRTGRARPAVRGAVGRLAAGHA